MQALIESMGALAEGDKPVRVDIVPAVEKPAAQAQRIEGSAAIKAGMEGPDTRCIAICLVIGLAIAEQGTCTPELVEGQVDARHDPGLVAAKPRRIAIGRSTSPIAVQ